MGTETQAPDNGTEKNENPSSGDTVDPRKTPAFQAVVDQLNAAKAELDQIRSKEADAAKAAEQKRLADAGRYEEAAANYQKEIDALRASQAAELRKRDLDSALISAGMTSKISRAGAASLCPADADIGQYVAGLKESDPAVFAAAQMTAPAGGPPQGVVNATPPRQQTWEEVNAKIRNPRTPKKDKDELKKIRDDMARKKAETGSLY